MIGPPVCGYRVVPYPVPYTGIQGVRSYDPHPFNSFYYRGQNFGIGIRF
jgi:hypothetical protein